MNKEIIATLKSPYTENQRMNFIVEYNHNQGCEIEVLEVETPEDGALEEISQVTLQAFKMVATDEEKAKEERERLDNLSMTRGDVFEALILAKGLGKAQIRAMIEQAELDTVTKALYLNRFDEALEFYRGYPIFDMLGQALGITGEMLDKFFDTKDYHNLISCKLTINPTPENATVTITPEIIPYNTTAHYKVECDGYITKEGDIEMVKDEVLEVVLDENTTDTEQPTNVSNEVETKTTDEPNAN